MQAEETLRTPAPGTPAKSLDSSPIEAFGI
jgi:hypothetical protein